MNTVGVAVIGCGYWGPNLIRNFKALPNCHVKWACDVNEQRLEHIRQLYSGTQTTSNIGRVIDDPEVDAVAIATPVSTHYDFARRSLLGGKHTFIEKPMTRSVRECKNLIDLAERSSLALMIGHTFVYTPAVRKMKEIIASGEIGEVLYISAQRLNLGLFQKDINVAWDLAPHDISIILYLLEEKPKSVNCQGKAHGAAGIEAVTNMSIKFDKGSFATIQSSWLDPNKIRLMTVVGSEKMIVYDDTEPLEKIKIYDKRVEMPRHYDTFGDFFYSYHYGGTYSPFIEQGEPLKVECGHFVEAVANNGNGAKCFSSGQDGLEVVKILEMSSASLARGGATVHISD